MRSSAVPIDIASSFSFTGLYANGSTSIGRPFCHCEIQQAVRTLELLRMANMLLYLLPKVVRLLAAQGERE